MRRPGKRAGSTPTARSFRSAPVDDVAGEQAEHDVLARLERVEQFEHAREQLHAVVVAFELRHEFHEVAREHVIHALVHVVVGESLEPHRLADDLLVRLAVVPVAGGPLEPMCAASARSIARRPAPFVQSSVPSMSNSAIFIRRAPVRARTAAA